MRLVTVLMHLKPIYGKAAWYIGLSGFFIFFLYKYSLLKTRSRQIDRQSLLTKINKKEQLDNDDYVLLSTLLCSIKSKKERLNFFFIFGFSAIAIVIALYVDFF